MNNFSQFLDMLALVESPSEEVTLNSIKNEYQKSICNLSYNSKFNLISDLTKTLPNNREIAKKILLIIETYPNNSMIKRMSYINKIGYALFDRKSLKGIAKYIGNSNVVEIGAGSGYLTFLLKYYTNVNITATDKSLKKYDWIIFQDRIKFNTNKNKLDDMFPECDTVIISWPKLYLKSLMDNLPNTITKIITIGEDVHGCTDCLYTSDDSSSERVRVYEFNESLNKKEYNFREVEHDIKLPCFNYIYDCIKFYERY